MGKLFAWIKKPENLFFTLLLIAVGIIGILDGNLEVIAIVYLFAYAFGLIIRLLFYLKNRYFDK